MAATSLHGAGRSAGALGRTVVTSAEDITPSPLQPPPAKKSMPAATKVSVGNTPKRLI